MSFTVKDLFISWAIRIKSPIGFSISPMFDGKTFWDLEEDGPLVINSTGSWTITPSENIIGKTKMWGCGAKSSGQYATSPGGSGGFSSGSVSFEKGIPYELTVGYNNGQIYDSNGLSGIFYESITQANSVMIAAGGGLGYNGADASAAGGSGGGSAGTQGGNYTGYPGTQIGGGGVNAYNFSSYYTGGSSLRGGYYNFGDGSPIGGAGYFGGGCGDRGGSGGSGYINTTKVSNGITVVGSGATPPNSSDVDRGSAGNGITGTGTPPSGKVIISLT